MNCVDVDRLLSEGRTLELSSPAILEHVRGCERCRALTAWAVQAVPVAPTERAVRDAVRARILADLSPVRPMPGEGWLLGLLGAIGGAALIWTLAFQGHAGWQRLGFVPAVVLTLFAAGAFALLGTSFVRLLRPGASQPAPIAMTVGVTLAGYGAWALGLFDANHASFAHPGGHHCLIAGLEMAAVVSAAVFLLARRGFALDRMGVGAVIGGLGGVAAIAGLQVSCPQLEALHLLVWHGLALAVSVVGGAALGRLATLRAA